MSITLSTQVTNILVCRDLNNSTTAYQKSLTQLSSGNKYTSTSDNPYEVSQSKVLATQISACSQISDNISIGSDVLTVAEGGQEQVISNLQRIRDLCVEAANGTYSSSDVGAILTEIGQRLSQIDQLADSTSFNGHNLLDGSSSSLKLQVGTSASETMSVGDSLINVHVSQLGTGTNADLSLTDKTTGEPLYYGGTWTSDDISAYIDKVDSAITQLTGASAKVGSYIKNLESKSATVTNLSNNLTDNKSAISDTDTAEASASLVSSQILQQASVSLYNQVSELHATMVTTLLGASS